MIRRILPLLTLLAGLYWVVMGTQYGVWRAPKMGSGFFPMVMGALTVFFSILVLLEREPAGGEKAKLDKLALLPFGAVMAMLLLTQVVGLIPSIALFIFLWMFVFEKSTLLSSVLTAVFTSGALYGVFGVWLQVRLP